jgi:hypothetical protein
MTDAVRPPIPMRLLDRPTIGGLVCPWVNVALADGGVDFRSAHNAKWQRCWLDRICQTCGQPLDRTVVLFGGPNQIKPNGYFTEPPLHPECAAYAAKACPMVAGRMPTYAEHDPLVEGKRGKVCPEPGCDCGGWQPDDGASHAGEPAHEWWAVWCTEWQLAVSLEGKLLGGVPIDVKKSRLISRPPLHETH